MKFVDERKWLESNRIVGWYFDWYHLRPLKPTQTPKRGIQLGAAYACYWNSSRTVTDGATLVLRGNGKSELGGLSIGAPIIRGLHINRQRLRFEHIAFHLVPHFVDVLVGIVHWVVCLTSIITWLDQALDVDRRLVWIPESTASLVFDRNKLPV